jgi:hypothetical protein
MARLLLELGNPSHWLPIWSYRLSAGVVWGLQKAIPEQVVPVLLDRRILAAKTTSLSGPPNWRYGGLIKPMLQTLSGHFSEALISNHRLTLNETALIFLEDLGEYRLKVLPAKWLPSFELDLWSYIGPEEDLGEFIRGRVRRLYNYVPSPTPVAILPLRNDRSSASLYNSSKSIIYIGFDSSVSPATAIEALHPGGQWVSDGGDVGEVWLVSDSHSISALQVVEYAQT